jgi:hypothetical protein
MSERWPRFGSRQPAVEPEASGPPSANGADPGDPAGGSDKAADAPVAAGDPKDGSTSNARIVAAVTSAPVSAIASDEGVARASEDEAGNTSAEGAGDEGAAAASTQVEAAAEPSSAAESRAENAATDDGSLFLAELVRAMQATAGQERTRIRQDTDRRREAHIDRVRARETAETERMRELAGEDMKAIEAWADGETKRIQIERERRERELNADLEASLAAHRSKIDREIEGVEVAIAAYRDSVDAFFDGFDRETDPVLVAQHAARRPAFPRLEAADETPGSTEPTMIGVMAADALAARIASWPGASAHTEGVGATAESVGATVGSGNAPGESLLETVPTVRPMSWLRRSTSGGDDGSNRQD